MSISSIPCFWRTWNGGERVASRSLMAILLLMGASVCSGLQCHDSVHHTARKSLPSLGKGLMIPFFVSTERGDGRGRIPVRRAYPL